MSSLTPTHRRNAALLAAAVCLVVALAAGVAVAQTTISGSGGTPEVNFPNSITVTSSSASGNEVVAATSDGKVTVNGTGTVWFYSVEGQFTNTTNLSVNNDPITIDPEDKAETTISGDLETFNYSTTVVNDGEVDFVYSGNGGQVEVQLTDVPPNEELSAVNQSGTVLNTFISNGDGNITFIMPSSTHNVTVQAQNASQIAPLYQNTTSPNTTAWTNGSTNSSLDTLADYAGRVPGLAIGGRSGAGAAASLVIGLLLTGMVVVGVSASGAGPVAGAVAGISVVGVIAGIGLLPLWVFAIVLFALGAVATAVVIRAWS